MKTPNQEWNEQDRPEEPDEFSDNEGPSDEDIRQFGGEESETSRCPSCGQEMFEDADRCSHCGEYVVGDGGSGSGRGTFAMWVVLTSVVMLILGLLCGFFL